MALTKKQQDFVHYYLECNDAFKAAELAGYTRRSVKRLLSLPELTEFLQADDEVATLHEVLLYFTSLMRKGSDDKVRLRAAELLAKYLAVDGEENGVSLVVNYDYED